jgi:hypothetical protein
VDVYILTLARRILFNRIAASIPKHKVWVDIKSIVIFPQQSYSSTKPSSEHKDSAQIVMKAIFLFHEKTLFSESNRGRLQGELNTYGKSLASFFGLGNCLRSGTKSL